MLAGDRGAARPRPSTSTGGSSRWIASAGLDTARAGRCGEATHRISAPMSSPDLVDTPAGGRRARARAADRARAARGFLDEHGIGDGRARGRAHRRRPLEHHLPGHARRRARSCCAARRARRCRPRPTTCCARRACSRRSRTRRCASRACSPSCDDESVIGVPFYVMEEVEGGVITSEIPDPLDTPEERRRIGERAGRRAGRGARRRLARMRARGLRQADRLPRAPAAPLHRPVGAQQDARAAARAGGRRLARGQHARVAARRRSCTATTGSATRWSADAAPAPLVSIFDWELSTIGDPLADLGYLTVTWVEPGDPDDTMFASLSAVTRREGFPRRDELIARYEERSGRSMSALHWYQALALWKAAVFMEGNYKRSLAGTTDDPYLKLFDEGVPALAEGARESRPVVTTLAGPARRLRRRAHHQRLRLVPRLLRCARASTATRSRRLFRDDPEGARAAARARDRRADRGRVRPLFGALLGVEDRDPGSSTGCSPACGPDEAMLDARAPRARRGHPDRADLELVGPRRLRPRRASTELFDGVVISGDVGLHKPQPEIFHAGRRAGRRSSRRECVFVDDLRENCDGAEAVGMTAVLHRGAETDAAAARASCWRRGSLRRQASTPMLLVLWDIDGTLVDSAGHGRYAFEEAFRRSSGSRPERASRWPGAPTTRSRSRCSAATTGTWRAMLEELAAALDERRELIARQGRPYPGVPEALAALHGRDDVVQSLLTGNIELQRRAQGRAPSASSAGSTSRSAPTARTRTSERSDLVARRARAGGGEVRRADRRRADRRHRRWTCAAAHDAGARAVAVATGFATDRGAARVRRRGRARRTSATPTPRWRRSSAPGSACASAGCSIRRPGAAQLTGRLRGSLGRDLDALDLASSTGRSPGPVSAPSIASTASIPDVDAAEDGVLAVEPRRGLGGDDEELAAVGVRAARWPSRARRARSCCR